MMRVDLSNLRAGMIVAKPVYNSHGTLMFHEGAELSTKNIWILKSWGVEAVWIRKEGEGGKRGGEDSKGQSNGFVRKDDQKKNCKGSEDEVMMEIRRIAARLIQQRADRNK